MSDGGYESWEQIVGLEPQYRGSGICSELDLGGLYEPVPAFGRWAGLLRIERNGPGVPALCGTCGRALPAASLRDDCEACDTASRG